jgi:hypothetical protein
MGARMWSDGTSLSCAMYVVKNSIVPMTPSSPEAPGRLADRKLMMQETFGSSRAFERGLPLRIEPEYSRVPKRIVRK